MRDVTEIPIVKIKVGEHEQRLETRDEGIDALAASIRRIGVINPLVVVAYADGLHLLAGHRRLVAARLAGKDTVPCIIRRPEGVVDSEITFAENFFRKDLSPVELACALKDVREKGEIELKDLAAGFHKSEHWVRAMIAIADWPADVQEAIHEQRISVSAASNLACVTDDSYRVFLVRNAVESGATARTTASWLQAWRAMQPQEEAITAEPALGGQPAIHAVPQAPCLCCSEIFPVDRMSHVPMCGECIKLIRQAMPSQGP
jgi:ParB family chromosome partitioning protein